MLRDSVAVVVVRTRPRAIPLAMITMRKFIDGLPFLSSMSMRLSLAVLRATGAPLKSIDTSLAVKGLREIVFLTPSLPREFPLTSKSVRQSKIYRYALGSERVILILMRVDTRSHHKLLALITIVFK